MQRNNTKGLYGFDIETYDNNKKFYCGSVVSDKIKMIFFDKNELIEFFKNPMFKNSYVAATNLGFDFMGVFHKTEEMTNFMLQFRGSDLIYAKTHINNKKFIRNNTKKKLKNLTFIDTLNYAKLSVKQMGKILNLPKLEKPVCLGRLPKSKEEKQELVTYNLRDSEISYKFINFLFNSFSTLGASPKLTIASTSMSLYKNKYLNNTYFRHNTDKLIEEFKGYYGGRVEAFKRGEIRNVYYYDFNSLYPSVMLNEFPDPNTLRICYKDKNTSYIESYDGISDVDIYCPEMKYPLLPYRLNNKLLFPVGNFRGWYSHLELRKAMELGYVIKKIYKTYYFKENCRPFYNFVNDLYDKRIIYKKHDNPMENVIKIILNSLYGKFGQKFMNRDNWIPIPDTIEELHKIPYTEMIGDYIRIKMEFTEPRSFCIPIWALYVTSYARLKLYDLILRSRPIYCDTDSVITEKEYQDSNKLGKLKLEFPIKYGVVVRPKFYGFVDKNNNERIKIKGLGTQLKYDEFTDFIQNPKTTYKKFMKFKESLRRGFTPNEIQDITKEMSLEDDKRAWESTFNFRELQDSKPLEIIDGVTETQRAEDMIKATQYYERLKEKQENNFLNSDLFDSKSVGKHISKKEFLKNKKWYAERD